MKAILFSLLLVSAAPAAQRVALVIGVSDYQHFGKLDNPRQDHAEMVKSLGSLGFSVVEKHNPTRQQIGDLAGEFAKSHPDAREVVFYYSGHGLQVQGRNYLTGTDSTLEVERGLDELDRTSLKGDALIMAKEAHVRQSAESSLMSLDVVLSALEKIGGKNCARVVILDCCRDNPLGTKTLAAKSVLPPKGGMGKVDAPRGMLIAFAAREGKTAAQTELGRPSLYTMALLKHIGTLGLEAEQVFKRTRATVLELSGEEQEPAEYTNLTGSLVFNPGTALAMPNAAAPIGAPQAPATLPQENMPMPGLPERGYFTLDELFSPGAYAGYNSYTRSHILKQAQTKLKSGGLYVSTVDGMPGKGTQQAIGAYQLAHQLPSTGKLDAATLKQMGLEGMKPLTPPVSRVNASGTAQSKSGASNQTLRQRTENSQALDKQRRRTASLMNSL